MDALEALRDHGLHAEKRGALGRPVPRRARPVLRAADHHEGDAGLAVGHGRVEDRRLRAVGPLGVAALDPVEHLVADADVGEGAAHHDLVVAAARSVGVEFARRDLPVGQVPARRGGVLERARRGDVVGRDHVAEQRQDARPDDVADAARRLGHVLEVGRVAHIGRGVGPVIGLGVRRRDSAPLVVAVEQARVFGDEGFAGDGPLDQLGHLRLARPEIPQMHLRAVGRLRHRLGGEVDVHGARQRVDHHERRRGEVVGAHVRGDASLEVAVAREHRDRDEVVLGDRRAELGLDRPGVADAGGAAVADEVEADFVEILLQPGRLEIGRDHLRTRREGRLDPGPAGQAQRGRLAGDESRGDHHVGVRGVGARGDRGDHHVAGAHGVVLARDRRLLVHRTLEGRLHLLAEGRLGPAQRHVVLRAARARDRGDDLAHV